MLQAKKKTATHASDRSARCNVPADMNVYSRPRLNRSERDKHEAGLNKQLHNLESKTDPQDGARSAKGKSLAAKNAIKIANELFQLKAGWALDHLIGLVLKDMESVPVKTTKPPKHADHSKLPSTDNDHRHEWYGRNWVGRNGTGFNIDPIVGRKLLISLVRANPGIFNLELMLMATSALEACDYGEIQPMLIATKKRRKVNWTVLHLQMRAIAYVNNREMNGIKKYKALEEVAGALGVGVDAVRTWEQRLRTEFGAFSVKANHPWDLQKLAQQYKAAVASKRALIS
jgi:hypothetical protein